MKKFALLLACLALIACETVPTQSSDQKQSEQQEQSLQEGNRQVGMPAIANFRERKLAKQILELRDQASLTTYTYTYAENTGQLVYLCDSIGFPLPYAAQFTSPSHLARIELAGGGYSYEVMPQADPNGLFTPSSAEGTWVMCKDPNGPDVKPVYVEPRVVTSPFKLGQQPKEIPLTVTGK